MSLYMSKSLNGQIDMSCFDEKNILKLMIKNETFKIIKMQHISDYKIILKTKVSLSVAEALFKKAINVADISVNWFNKKFIDYDILSLKYVLENDIDNYIIKLKLNCRDVKCSI